MKIVADEVYMEYSVETRITLFPDEAQTLGDVLTIREALKTEYPQAKFVVHIEDYEDEPN